MLIQRDDDLQHPTASEYRKLIIEYRKRQLRMSEERLKSIEAVFDAAVKAITARVLDSEDALQLGYYTNLLAGIQGTLAQFRDDYAHLLTAGMVENAQIAADREAATAALLEQKIGSAVLADRSTSFLISGAPTVTVRFGDVAQTAVERISARVYSDGWRLSDRLYNLDAATLETVRQTLVQGVTEQVSARAMAKRLQGALAQAGADNPRYQAMRIARTEINTTHREAHILSAQDANGQLHPWILAIGWRLSVSHPHLDICDIWADDDIGLGPGNYQPGDVPSDHPHGLCYTVSVLVDYPDVAAPSKEADADGVSETQVRYYAEKYDDPTAQRWLAKRGA